MSLFLIDDIGIRLNRLGRNTIDVHRRQAMPNTTTERRHSKQPDEFPDNAEVGQVPSFGVEHA